MFQYFLYWMLKIKVHKCESSVFQQILLLCSPTYKRTRTSVIVFFYLTLLSLPTSSLK